jgi:hypothetical protein
MMAIRFIEQRPLLLARFGLLTGFLLFLLCNLLALVYIATIILMRGNTAPVWDFYTTTQSLVLSLDVVAGGLLAVGFWNFGRRHDYLGPALGNLAIGFGLFALVTLTWRLRLMVTPFEEVNPVSRLATGGGAYSKFVPQFEFFHVNFVGFMVSALLMFILMNLLAGVIRNYRVFENFQDTNLGLLRVYGILYLVGSVSMGIGWFTFSPGITGTGLGDLLLGVFVLSWVVLYIFLPLLGIRVFTTAFNIHRGALETAGFILRRKMEREEAATAPRVGAALGGGRPGR